MGIIIICSILGLYFGFRSSFKDFQQDRFLFFVQEFLYLTIGVLVGALLTMPVILIAPTHNKIIDQYEIVNIRDNIGMKGNFLNFNSDLDYYVYKKSGDGIVNQKIPKSNTTIQYGDDNSHVIVSTKKPNGYWRLFALPLYGDNYVIFLPNGSIKNDFILDNE